MTTLRIPRGSSPALRVTIYTGKRGASPVMNLTGVPLAIVNSNMETLTPSIALDDGPAGKALLTFPEMVALAAGRSYKFSIRVGAAGAPGTFVTPPVEVVVT